MGGGGRGVLPPMVEKYFLDMFNEKNYFHSFCPFMQSVIY